MIIVWTRIVNKDIYNILDCITTSNFLALKPLTTKPDCCLTQQRMFDNIIAKIKFLKRLMRNKEIRLPGQLRQLPLWCSLCSPSFNKKLTYFFPGKIPETFHELRNWVADEITKGRSNKLWRCYEATAMVATRERNLNSAGGGISAAELLVFTG